MSLTSVKQIDEWRAAKSETEHLEFKEAKNKFAFDHLLRYCVAIGNEGGGKLLLGITNNPPRHVVGTSVYPNTQKIASDLLNKLRFRVDVEEVAHPDGRVLIFHIPPRPFRHAFEVDGTYYMRSGESLVAMTPDRLKKIFNETTGHRSRPAFVLLLLLLVVATAFIGYRVWTAKYGLAPPSAATRTPETGTNRPPLADEDVRPKSEPTTREQPAQPSVQKGGTPKVQENHKFVGVHKPDETTVIPPGASAIISPGPLSPEERHDLDRLNSEEDLATKHLNQEPDKLTVKDLFWKDFSSSENTFVRYGGFTIRNDKVGSMTHISSAVINEMQAGVKMLAFYIPYTNETPDIAISLAGMYKKPLDDYLEGAIVTGKAATGDSEQLSSQNLILSNRVFVYHEVYLSPEQIIEARNAWKNQGITVVFRSTDYLENKKLQARMKLLEHKK
jgi:hypothetical protein